MAGTRVEAMPVLPRWRTIFPQGIGGRGLALGRDHRARRLRFAAAGARHAAAGAGGTLVGPSCRHALVVVAAAITLPAPGTADRAAGAGGIAPLPRLPAALRDGDAPLPPADRAGRGRRARGEGRPRLRRRLPHPAHGPAGVPGAAQERADQRPPGGARPRVRRDAAPGHPRRLRGRQAVREDVPLAHRPPVPRALRHLAGLRADPRAGAPARSWRWWRSIAAPPGPRSLELRDAAAARPIARAAKAADRPLVLVLVGQFHVTPCHLPAPGARRCWAGPRASRWSSTRTPRASTGRWPAPAGWRRPARCEISERELCLVNTSPVVCQRSFLDYVEAEAGDAPIDESGIALTFRHLARDIGRFTGSRWAPRPTRCWCSAPATSTCWSGCRSARRFTPAEVTPPRAARALAGERLDSPGPGGVAGLALAQPRRRGGGALRSAPLRRRRHGAAPLARREAFWARCLEEALGFFGSRLVNPKRRCTQLRRVDLALRVGPRRARSGWRPSPWRSRRRWRDDFAAAQKMVPLSSSVAAERGQPRAGVPAGRRAGPGLRAQGDLAAADVRALFRDPFETPAITFAALARRLSAFGSAAAARLGG